jgi:hypothetical protein
MFCSKCGVKLDDDVKFCLKCGTSVVNSTVNISAQPVTPKNDNIQPIAPQKEPFQTVTLQPQVSVDEPPSLISNDRPSELRTKFNKNYKYLRLWLIISVIGNIFSKILGLESFLSFVFYFVISTPYIIFAVKRVLLRNKINREEGPKSSTCFWSSALVITNIIAFGIFVFYFLFRVFL